jgi:hypothetical protein
MASVIPQDPEKAVIASAHSVTEGPLTPTDDISTHGSEKGINGIQEDADDDAVASAVVSGFPLVMLTIGMMTVVFLVALDHYILGMPQMPNWYTVY